MEAANPLISSLPTGATSTFQIYSNDNCQEVIDHQMFTIGFWSQLFMILAALAAFIYGVLYGYRMKQLRFIPYYTMASILETSVDFISVYIIKEPRKSFSFPDWQLYYH
jgi:hypothetical protein